MNILEKLSTAWADYDRRVAHFIGTAYLGEGEQRAEHERAKNTRVNVTQYGLKLKHTPTSYINTGYYA